MKLFLILILLSVNSFAGYVAGSKANQCDRSDYSTPGLCQEAEGEACYLVPSDSGDCGVFKLQDLYGNIKFDEETCEGQLDCQGLLMEKVCGADRVPFIDLDYSEVYCVEVIGKELQIDAALKAAADSKKAIAAYTENLILNGKNAREACNRVLDLIGGFNLLPGRTTEQAGQMTTSFATALEALKNGRPGAAKTAIIAIPVDGVLVTQAMKDLALAQLGGY